MGMITEYFVADEETARDYDHTVLSNVRPNVDLPEGHAINSSFRLTSMELGKLYEITLGHPLEGDYAEAVPMFEMEGGGEVVTCRFLPDFRRRLAEAGEAERTRWAEKWSRIPELPDREAEQLRATVEDELERLHRLAKLAADNNEELFLWMSL